MGKRAKPTTIISASLGIASYLVERGLDMAGITISIGWAIVLWVISGVLILVAIIVGFKSYIWPFLRSIRIVRNKVEETAIQSSTPDFTQKYATWMTVAIQDDVRDLPGCIIVNEPHICWEHLEEREDAYIEINFDIWSSSVLLLEISKQVEGHISFQNGELERIPEITQKANHLSHLRRSRSAQLTIRQWLSFPVKARMKTEYGSQVEFDFSKVNISVVATLLDGSEGATCRLPIPNTVRAQMPNHPNAL